MLFMPFNIVGIWLRGLFSIAIIGGGMYRVGTCPTLSSSRSRPPSTLA